MLEQNFTLTALDLRWNSIRLNSADVLSASLAKNCTLRTLRLGNNAFGENAVELMGQSLKVNSTLQNLDLSYNNMNTKSMSVLSNALIYNDTLKELNVDGCLLGDVGTQAFIGAIQRAAGSKRKLNVSFDKSDCEHSDPSVFNPSNPTGTWEVDLSTPYGRMVTEECLFLCNNKVGCHLLSVYYKSVGGVRKKIDLVHNDVKSNARSANFDEREFRALSVKFTEMLKEEKMDDVAKVVPPLVNMFGFKVQS